MRPVGEDEADRAVAFHRNCIVADLGTATGLADAPTRLVLRMLAIW
jgi:hypothetical protein